MGAEVFAMQLGVIQRSKLASNIQAVTYKVNRDIIVFLFFIYSYTTGFGYKYTIIRCGVLCAGMRG